MTLKVEMVTFDGGDPAKLASWWADQFGGTTQEMIPGEFIAVMRSEGQAIRIPEGARSHAGKESSAPRFQRRGCGRRSVAADGSGGATELGRHQFSENFRWVVLADPEGNAFCVAGQ